ncbi:extracellular catalytic domain type 1 short-chain-length polyhydroxyalkanoate depolymerase [Gloeothece verrucosa]|uniref:Esterase, PHB depolymerase family n=1 Tax=Gloeothece verrucosa (strain PCC 7822) TaxID=497965 RepID=E0ULK8_GLOV7|nr:PHB depolymerase family esterase [Gloeothece verrucosa]ADN17838.1 esterase, PHB depolymerase family [Gloeothece verrucosa PCC 7822]
MVNISTYQASIESKMMENPILAKIAQATELTQAGRLKEATQLIQRTLQNLKDPSTTDEVAVAGTDEIIDVTAVVIDEPINSTAHPGQTRTEPTPASSEAVDFKEQPRREATEFPQSPKKSSIAISEQLNSILNFFPQLKSQAQPAKNSDPQTKGGQFIEGYYTKGTQSRSYKLYIPGGYTGQALPVVVMLHGCNQSVDDFANGTRMNLWAEEELFFVVYPAQEKKANGSLCWNWFNNSDQQRGRGEPSIIAGITEQVVSTYNLDQTRVYVSGMSAGGAMAGIMGICYPDVYAAVGIHSGLPYRAAGDLQGAFAAMRGGGNGLLGHTDENLPHLNVNTRFVPIIVFHGDRDSTVHPVNSEKIIAQWALIHSQGNSSRSEKILLRPKVLRERVKNGHAYTRSIYHDLNGYPIMERWLVHGSGHGWSGGSASGSFTDVQGPNASREMLRFFKEQTKTSK